MPEQRNNQKSSFTAKKPSDKAVGSFDGTFNQGANARPGAPYPSFGGNAGGGKDNGKFN